MSLTCDMCGDCVEEDIEISDFAGRPRKVQNFGYAKHDRNGNLTVRCLRCNKLLKKPKKNFVPKTWNRVEEAETDV